MSHIAAGHEPAAEPRTGLLRPRAGAISSGNGVVYRLGNTGFNPAVVTVGEGGRARGAG
jgi:hypothetical protein